MVMVGNYVGVVPKPNDDSSSFSSQHGGVGHKLLSSFYNKYVVPRWWRELFIGNDGLLRFIDDSKVRINICYSCTVDLNYRELISCLDSSEYIYRLPSRWRVKIPRDVRRRKGIVVVRVTDGVNCLIKVERGRCVSVQVVGDVRDAKSLDNITDFLKEVFGIEIRGEDLVCPPTIRPDFNQLKRLSWWVIRRAEEDWLPVTELGERVAKAVAERLSRESRWWIDVVAAPRTGKSSGVIFCLVMWAVESGADGYVIVVVVPNRRLGRQLYRFALGAWKRVLRSLRVYGWNAGMLAERVRIRYYEGMEDSCLLGKREHRVEDCLKCPLNQQYQSAWRKVYKAPVPVLDPVILRFSGFCPFQVLFNRVFWRNLIVIINYRLLPLLPYVLSQLNLRRVIVYFDEYLFHLMHRVVFRPVKESLR
uniref:Uncharacterized protein n=1 Tax=Ignisphaera aggregans TaxID=334771 RepID=A0A7J3Z5B8_9CREN